MEMPYSKIISFLLVSMLLNQCAPCVYGGLLGGLALGAGKAASPFKGLLNGAKNELIGGYNPKFPSPNPKALLAGRKNRPSPSETALEALIKKGVRKCLSKNVKAKLKLAVCGKQLTEEEKAACCSTLDGTTPSYSTVRCPCLVDDGTISPQLDRICERPSLAHNLERCP